MESPCEGKYLKDEILKYVRLITPKDPLSMEQSLISEDDDVPDTLQHGLRFIADQVLFLKINPFFVVYGNL
jgi:hypothetical protein